MGSPVCAISAEVLVLFGDPSRKYRKKAHTLISNCQAFAMTTFDDFAAISPVVAQLQQRGDTERWDVVITIAGAGMALGLIENDLPEKQFVAFHKALVDGLAPWYPSAPDLLMHQIRFIVQRQEQGVSRDIAIGEWAVSNLKGGSPTVAEMKVAPVIGEQLQNALIGWWTRI